MNPTETRIYTRAMELVDVVRMVTARFPYRHRPLADQLERASSSVPLTFIEGFSQKSARHRAHYFRTAMGSANECAAALDVARRWRLVDDDTAARGIDAATHVAAMLRRFK